MAEIEMIPVTGSTRVSAAGYDKETKTMRVEFASNGALYDYDDVPESVYQNLLQAPSAGNYFQSAVVNAGYSYRRIS